MDKASLLWERLQQSRLIALLTPSSTDDCVRAYEALQPLGVVLEIALRSDAALDGLAAVTARHPDALVLAGTVLTRAQADAAIGAGAAGVVSPDYVPLVVGACVARKVLCIPGGLGDVGKQLVQKAESHGCTLGELRQRYPYQWIHKLFPAMAGAATPWELAAAWRAVYGDLAIIYAGGISATNVGTIIQHDPAALICASALTRCAGDVEQMRAEAERWLGLIHGRAAEARPDRLSAVQRAAAGAPTVVTFGELMLRLAPPRGARLIGTDHLDVSFGGAEANVAVALAQLGLDAHFVSAVPEHALGQAAVNALRRYGVNTDHVLRQGTRLGLYYLEYGAAQRPSQVIYDRAGSAVAELQPDQIDWDAALTGARWFHCTGITPALSPSAAQVTLEALRAAHAAGATVSFDLNYRAKLWTPEQARATLTPLMEYVDIVLTNEEDAARVFGITAAQCDPGHGQLDTAAYRAVAEQLCTRFGLQMAAITLRASRSADVNMWSACLFDGNEFYQSRSYELQVVDRIGAGDAFAAGLIYGLLSQRGHLAALEFATAAACLKHSLAGDFSLVSAPEIDALLAGNTTGRVQR